MKYFIRAIIISFLLLTCLNLYSQAPQFINYQFVLRGNTADLIVNSTIGLRASIIETSAVGTVVYSETQTVLSNEYGLVNLEIGGGNVASGAFPLIDWGANDHYLKVEIDTSGGTNYVAIGTSQLLSVPYALHAGNAANGHWVNVRTFGAAGDGSADDTSPIQAAINSIPDGGSIYFPPGTYRTTSTITLSRSNMTLHADAATILSDHNGIALDLSPTSTWLFNTNIEGHLTIQKQSIDKTNGSIGIRMRNNYQGSYKGFSILNFNYGLQLLGDGAGTVYNILEPRNMKNNWYQIDFTTLNNGWVNQNTITGGRWWFTPGNGGTGAIFVRIADINYGNNGNMFNHLSTEAHDAGTTITYCTGNFNSFIDFRSEIPGLQWVFTQESHSNLVLHGTYIHIANINDQGDNNIITDNGNATTMTTNLQVGPRVTGYGANNIPDNYVMVASEEVSESVGIYFPVMDGSQNSRAWLKMTPDTKILSLSHNWSSGGDLSYHFNRDRMVIKAITGNVGINTTAPTEKLHVVGNVLADAHLNISDRRYKQDIQRIDGAMESLKQINGVRYNWKKDDFPKNHFSSESQIGVIAQELEEVYPELVNTGADGYKSVDYPRLTAVLIEALKEQQAEISTQNVTLQVLEEKVEKLEVLVMGVLSSTSQ